MNTFHIKTPAGIHKKESLAETLGADPAKDNLMFISAHDDDSPIGAGMVIAKAVEEGFSIYAVIATNGIMGYCSAEQKNSIVEIRAKETLESYKVLGVPESNIHWLDFDDGTLYSFIGRRKAAAGESEVKGFTGMENHLTEIMRRLKPAHIFSPAGSDLHPDHQAVYKDMLISIFHASGDIWPELGEKIELPEIYEFPTYVNLDGDPEIMFEASEEIFNRKIKCVECYQSQKQIDAMVNAIKNAGAVEFFRNIHFELYDPQKYRKLFI